MKEFWYSKRITSRYSALYADLLYERLFGAIAVDDASIDPSFTPAYQDVKRHRGHMRPCRSTAQPLPTINLRNFKHHKNRDFTRPKHWSLRSCQ